MTVTEAMLFVNGYLLKSLTSWEDGGVSIDTKVCVLKVKSTKGFICTVC